jgi:hypothetical protein
VRIRHRKPASGVRSKPSSITAPAEILLRAKARAAAFDMPLSRFVRYLVRNDTFAPVRGLAAIIAGIPPSKFTYPITGLSMPPEAWAMASARAKQEKLDVSPYIVALIVRDIQANHPAFVILRSPVPKPRRRRYS